MQVECFLRHGSQSLLEQGDGAPFCSFVISRPFKSQSILDGFPYEGAFFHFRVKLPGSALGFSDVDHVWVDMVSTIDEDIDWGVVCEPLEVLEVQVLLLDVPWDTEVLFMSHEQALADLQETMLYLPSEKREKRRAFQSQQQSTISGSTLATLFKRINKVVNQNNQETSPATQAEGPIKINLQQSVQSMQKGATSLWNILKVTAQQPGLGLGGSSDSSSNTLPVARENLSELSQSLMTVYQEGCKEHEDVIRQLWKVTFLSDPVPTVGASLDSPLWKSCGWQKTHPMHDLKSSGLLALECMIYFGEVYQQHAQSMIQRNKTNVKENYPYAIVCVNLTLLLADLFMLKNQGYANKHASYFNMFEEKEAFFEIFSSSLLHVDVIWTRKQAVRSQFGMIISEVKTLLQQILARNPSNIWHFRDIAKQEGMAGL